MEEFIGTQSKMAMAQAFHRSVVPRLMQKNRPR